LAEENDEIFVDAAHAARARERNVPILRVFGNNLRLARVALGLTHADIERKTGLAGNYLDQIEAGRTDPSLRTMIALARAVERDLDTLLLEPVTANQTELSLSDRPPSRSRLDTL